MNGNARSDEEKRIFSACVDRIVCLRIGDANGMNQPLFIRNSAFNLLVYLAESLVILVACH